MESENNQDKLNKEILDELRLIRKEMTDATNEIKKNQEKLTSDFRSMQWKVEQIKDEQKRMFREIQETRYLLRNEINDSVNILTENLKKKFPCNWNDLPPEMKIQCIERMNVRERFHLRNTCKTERELVDSQKWKLKEVEILVMKERTNIFIIRPGEEYCEHLKFPRGDDQKLPSLFIEFLLNIGIIEEFRLDYSTRVTDSNDNSEFPKTYYVGSFQMEEDLTFCLSKLNNAVKKIRLDGHDEDGFPIEQVLTIPCVINVPYWQIEDLNRSDCAHKVAQVYIDKDVEIGRTFQVKAKSGYSGWDLEPPTIEQFSTEFVDRIISKTEDKIRIRTDNPSKHILLELGSETRDLYDYLRLQVISADMKESEYETDCIKWMSNLSSYLLNYNEYDYDSDDYEYVPNVLDENADLVDEWD